MARNAVVRRPRGRETMPERPSALRLWLRRRRGLVRPTLYGLGLLAVLGSGAAALLALDPAGRLAQISGTVSGISTGLVVQHIDLEGRRNAPLAELRQAIGTDRGAPILAFSPQAARERLEANAWVASAEVERRLPDRILVRIVERQPYAIWQHAGVLRVIDNRGVVISDRVAEFGLLPLVVGAGANLHAAAMVELLRATPELRDRTDALVRVGNRRWNLKLRNGTEIRLPEGLEAQALARLREQQQAIGLLDRPVAAIDLRLPDKMTVQVSPTTPASPAPSPTQAVRSQRG